MPGDRLVLVNDEGGQPCEVVAATRDGRIDAGVLGQVGTASAEGLKAMLASGATSVAYETLADDQGRLPLNRGLARSKDDQMRWSMVLPLKNREVYKKRYFSLRLLLFKTQRYSLCTTGEG